MDGAKSTLYLQKPRAQPTQQTISHAQINNYQNAILAQRQIRVSRPSHNSYLRNRAKKSLLFMPCKTNHSQRASLSLLTIYLHNHTNHITSQTQNLLTLSISFSLSFFLFSLSFVSHSSLSQALLVTSGVHVVRLVHMADEHGVAGMQLSFLFFVKFVD